MWLRSHILVITLLVGASTVGAFLGNRAAASELDGFELPALPLTIDKTHPIEAFYVPPFLKTLTEVEEHVGLTVYPEDRVTMTPPLDFGLGGQLVIERALPVTLKDGATETQYRTWAKTVGDLIGEQRIELGSFDRSEPALNQLLTVDLAVTITRVTVTEVTKHEAMAFATRTEDDSNRPRGERQIIQRGQSGKKQLTYQVTRENGKETARKLVKTDVVTEPIDEVIAIGTRVITLGEGRATWYDPPWSGFTAAHNTLPKGTMVDVVNVRTGKRVTVKINDRGIQSTAVIDLSVEAFRELGSLRAGVLDVRLEIAG